MNTQAARSYRWLFALLALVGLTADQASKYGIFAALYADGPLPNSTWLGSFEVETRPNLSEPDQWEWHRRVELIPGIFHLTAVHSTRAASPDDWRHPLQTISGPNLPRVNHGALFGMKPLPPQASNALFAVVSFIAALAILYWSGRPAVRRERFLSLALGLILAGTLGNFYDRVIFGGVRDFLDFHYGDWVWPTFNIADCCLVCGACALVIHAFLYAEQEDGAAPPQSVEAAPATASAPPAP